jgi:hypothetical protein
MYLKLNNVQVENINTINMLVDYVKKEIDPLNTNRKYEVINRFKKEQEEIKMNNIW